MKRTLELLVLGALLVATVQVIYSTAPTDRGPIALCDTDLACEAIDNDEIRLDAM